MHSADNGWGHGQDRMNRCWLNPRCDTSLPLLSGTCHFVSEFCWEANFCPGVGLAGVKLPPASMGLGKWEGHL